MAATDLTDATAIAGVGNTRFGNFPETDDYGLAVDALRMALDDAGLTIADVDGLIVHRLSLFERAAEVLGIDPRFTLQLQGPGRFSAISIMEAAQAIHAGMADVIALVYGNNGRSVRQFYGGIMDAYGAPWGMTSPGAIHAQMARRHMSRFGTTSEQLGHVGMTIRRHAALNDNAVMQEPYTIEDHQNSRYIVDPLRLLDYCLINDGGMALIMTSAERAKDLKKPPVYVSGWARQDAIKHSTFPAEDFWLEPLRKVTKEAYEMSGLGQDAVDALMIYDNFTPTVIFSLEGIGVCEQGEGGPFVAGGNIRLGARWPTNTSGGHLSESYMQGWGLLAESVRQLRGECGGRQVENCNVVQYVCATNCPLTMMFRRD